MTGSIGYNGRLTMNVRGYNREVAIAGFGLKPKAEPPNVVGGSLDGASIPNGTRDGQTLRWDEQRLRWIGS